MGKLYLGEEDVCKFCGWHEAWSHPTARKLAALWHAWDEHRDIYLAYARKHRLDIDEIGMTGQPRPEAFGHRVRVVAVLGDVEPKGDK